MIEVRVNKNYLFSLWIKAFLVLFIFWGMVYLILILLNSISLQIEISSGQDNSLIIFTLFNITFGLAAIGAFVYYSLLKNSSMIRLEEDGIKIIEGIIKRKETLIPYKEIKNAHCDEDSLSIVDNFLKISIVKIHASETVSMVGISNGTDLVNEINHMAELNKEIKSDPITILMEEVKSLKNEIADLKEKIQKVKEQKKPETIEKKKKFKIGPFNEIIN